jgi:hypothetical protein
MVHLLQVKYNPYIDSKLDLIETLLTLIFLFVSATGVIFSLTGDDPSLSGPDPSANFASEIDVAQPPKNGIQPFVRHSLEWLSFIGIVAGTAISFTTVVNEALEKSYIWYLLKRGVVSAVGLNSVNRTDGDASRKSRENIDGEQPHDDSTLDFSQHMLAYSTREYSTDFDAIDLRVFYPISMYRFLLAVRIAPEERSRS